MDITEQSLMIRVNRRLVANGRALRKCRPDAAGFGDTGQYFMVDLGKDKIIETHVNLADLGIELGVLRENENVV